MYRSRYVSLDQLIYITTNSLNGLLIRPYHGWLDFLLNHEKARDAYRATNGKQLGVVAYQLRSTSGNTFRQGFSRREFTKQL